LLFGMLFTIQVFLVKAVKWGWRAHEAVKWGRRALEGVTWGEINL
jgi:hypothetical protein